MIRPTATATVSRRRARGTTVPSAGRHGGVEAQLVGDAVDPHGVVGVRHQHDLGDAVVPQEAGGRGERLPACSRPCVSRSMALAGDAERLRGSWRWPRPR